MKVLPATLIAALALAGLAQSGAAAAQDSGANASAASAASVDVAADLTASGVQTALGASVLPASTAAVGSAAVGSVAAGAGNIAGRSAMAMSTAAGDSVTAQGPLPVTRKVIVSAQPAPRVPYDAMAPTPAAAPGDAAMIRNSGPAALAAGLIVALAVGRSSALAASNDSISTSATVAHLTPVQAAAFSKQIEDDLAGRGARVAIVFRTGRPHDKLPKGISYTHGAFWVYRTIQTADGSSQNGYAVYNLYAGDGRAWPVDRSRLVQDWPVNFALGSVVDDVAVIVPSPEMQRRILAVIDSPTYERLHNDVYSLVANPLSDKYQNCNDFMLDVIASAAWSTTDPAQIRADERAHFTPTVVHAGGLMRVFGPMVDKRIKTDDQSGEIRTATYESMSAFMHDNGLLEAAYILNRKP